jgi:hypothetical protein
VIKLVEAQFRHTLQTKYLDFRISDENHRFHTDLQQKKLCRESPQRHSLEEVLGLSGEIGCLNEAESKATPFETSSWITVMMKMFSPSLLAKKEFGE